MSLNVYWAITTIYTQFLTLICPLTGVEDGIYHQIHDNLYTTKFTTHTVHHIMEYYITRCHVSRPLWCP